MVVERYKEMQSPDYIITALNDNFGGLPPPLNKNAIHWLNFLPDLKLKLSLNPSLFANLFWIFLQNPRGALPLPPLPQLSNFWYLKTELILIKIYLVKSTEKHFLKGYYVF